MKHVKIHLKFLSSAVNVKNIQLVNNFPSQATTTVPYKVKSYRKLILND